LKNDTSRFHCITNTVTPDTTGVYSSRPAIYNITNTVTPDTTGVYSTTLAIYNITT
jgi:hydroxyethylthiazole kinase-like sugar kinase family protein